MQRIFVKDRPAGWKLATPGELSAMTGIFRNVIRNDVVEQIPRGKKKGIMCDAMVPMMPDCSDINGYGVLNVNVLRCTEDFKSKTMGKGMKDELQKFSQRKEHAERGCSVVVLMTHGKEGHIYGTDDKTVPLKTIFSMFDDDSCPRLSGKPKLFFIQACQGDKWRRQASATADAGFGTSSPETKVPPVWKTDMFIAFASPMGHEMHQNIPVSPLTIHSYVVSTEGRVIREAGGVELVFPKDCVSEERVISVEVDVIPINTLINQKFMALSAVLTVKQSRNTHFLEPVTVTLPWMWRKYASKPQVNTTLMHFEPSRGWSVVSAHLQEAEHTLPCRPNSAQRCVPCGKIWKGYAEDKVHLSIIPNATTREITMLCTHKLQDQQEFFFMSEEQLKHQFKQQVYMKSNEKIKATITEESDIEIEKYDIPRGGITFYFPPATANRYSLRLKAKEGVIERGEYEGSIQFDRIQAGGHTTESTMDDAINNALIYLRPRSQAMAHTDNSSPRQGSIPASKGSDDLVQIFEKVVKGVGTSWKELALQLELSYEAVQVIDQNVKLKDDFDKCRDVLHQWRQNNGKKATLEVLKQALSQIGMSSVKDEL
ncbi:luteolysis [Branchiostoma belcheri]|nr:luteolysis [Branchiostoma belcheri]